VIEITQTTRGHQSASPPVNCRTSAIFWTTERELLQSLSRIEPQATSPRDEPESIAANIAKLPGLLR
jgi:hypothetical protein